MLMITGATGTVGRPLIDLLAAAGAHVRAVTRHPRTAGLPAGVELVKGDPSRPATIADALEGPGTLFLNPAAAGASAGDLLTLARDRGIKRVVLLSALAVDEPHVIGAHHRALEDSVTECGLDWVILRPGMFAANTLSQWGAQIRAGDVVRGPYAESTDAPIHEADLVEVAARALLTDELTGQRLRLTGPESLTRTEMVAAIGAAVGRPLRYEEIPPEAARRDLLGHGLPEPYADAMLSMWETSVGYPAIVTTDVDEILGRPARTFAEWAADHATAF